MSCWSEVKFLLKFDTAKSQNREYIYAELV